MDLIIRNVQIAGGDGSAADIGIKDGQIAAVGKIGSAQGAEVIDGTGLYAFPGLCDLHSHLRDPGFTHKEDLRSGTCSAAAGGFTDVCCMPNTKPPIDSVEVIEDILERAADLPAGVHPVASITQGMKGKRLSDFAALRHAGAIAFSDDGLPVEDIDLMREALQASERTGMLLMVHEENRELAGHGVANAGEHAEQAGLEGIPSSSEEEMVARDLFLAGKYGGRLHFCHISTAGSLELIRRFKAAHPHASITCETAPHYFSATDDFILTGDPNAKMNPPLRSERDRQAVIEALQDGTIDAIATDHAPHSPQEKDTSFAKAPFGIIGFETALPLAITNLSTPGHLTLEQIVRLMSSAPREIAGLPGGRIAEGQPADIVLCDVDASYVYKPEMVVSKSRNSPFFGSTLRGRTIRTLRGGRTVWPQA